ESLGADGMGQELDAHYAAVEERIEVNTDESIQNAQNAALARGLDALGKPWSVIPRNARGCGDCGHCGYGCRAGAKRSSARTFLADAVGLGARVVTDCEARTITTAGGSVTGVTAMAGDRRITIRAKQVVLAGGAIGTPALLLRSGLGGSNAGRRLFLHPVPAVFARYADPIRMWSGVPQSVVSDAFARVHPAAGAREVRTFHTRPLVLEPGGDVGAFADAVARRGVAPNTVGVFSAHQMGTAGMGSRRESVSDPDGAVRGLRGLHV